MVGTITLSFYFLEHPRKSSEGRVPRKVVDLINTVPEKAVKGEALTYQLRYETLLAHTSLSGRLSLANFMIASARHRTRSGVISWMPNTPTMSRSRRATSTIAALVSCYAPF